MTRIVCCLIVGLMLTGCDAFKGPKGDNGKDGESVSDGRSTSAAVTVYSYTRNLESITGSYYIQIPEIEEHNSTFEVIAISTVTGNVFRLPCNSTLDIANDSSNLINGYNWQFYYNLIVSQTNPTTLKISTSWFDFPLTQTITANALSWPNGQRLRLKINVYVMTSSDVIDKTPVLTRGQEYKVIER